MKFFDRKSAQVGNSIKQPSFRFSITWFFIMTRRMTSPVNLCHRRRKQGSRLEICIRFKRKYTSYKGFIGCFIFTEMFIKCINYYIIQKINASLFIVANSRNCIWNKVCGWRPISSDFKKVTIILIFELFKLFNCTVERWMQWSCCYNKW